MSGPKCRIRSCVNQRLLILYSGEPGTSGHNTPSAYALVRAAPRNVPALHLRARLARAWAVRSKLAVAHCYSGLLQ